MSTTETAATDLEVSTGTLLTITTGNFLTESFDEFHHAAEVVMGQPFFTHMMASRRLADDMRREVLRQHPWLAEWDDRVPSFDGLDRAECERVARGFVGAVSAEHGARHTVTSPPETRRVPLLEGLCLRSSVVPMSESARPGEQAARVSLQRRDARRTSSQHWFLFGRSDPSRMPSVVVAGCGCGFIADVEADNGYGDSVIDHIAEAVRADERDRIAAEFTHAATLDYPGPGDTPAWVMSRAANNLLNGYEIGGSGVKAAVARVLVAAARLVREDEPT